MTFNLEYKKKKRDIKERRKIYWNRGGCDDERARTFSPKKQDGERVFFRRKKGGAKAFPPKNDGARTLTTKANERARTFFEQKEEESIRK